MKALIVGVALTGLAWYFLIYEKPRIEKVPGNGNGNGDAGNGGSGGSSTDAQDALVLQMIKEITAAYPDYTSPDQFSEARTRLYNASQPVIVACLVAPCPAIPQVSKPVEDQAKALLEILDQKLQFFMQCKGGGCGNIIEPAALGLDTMLAPVMG